MSEMSACLVSKPKDQSSILKAQLKNKKSTTTKKTGGLLGLSGQPALPNQPGPSQCEILPQKKSTTPRNNARGGLWPPHTICTRAQTPFRQTCTCTYTQRMHSSVITAHFKSSNEHREALHACGPISLVIYFSTEYSK